MKKVRKFSVRKFLLFLMLVIILFIILVVGIYKFETSAVSSKSTEKDFTIEKGDNYFTIASTLKENNLIKSETFYKIYLKIHKPQSLINGTYRLNENMSVSEIIKVLSNKDNKDIALTKMTFREGLNIRQMANIVEKQANISSLEFINKVSDQNYIKSLQNKYWFLTDSIYNNQIYYTLEGYLFPDTYHFTKEELTLEKIIEKILDNTDKKLTPYKDQIQNSSYNIHQILTLSSLVELEAVNDKDRAMVAGIFYNRLNNGWSLGSDVTTYYAAKKNMTDKLTKSELNNCNGYNTRCTSMQGLPVGPIANPSISSINATLNPIKSNYYYFVADTNKQVYFSKDANEHTKIISKLKEQGKWAA